MNLMCFDQTTVWLRFHVPRAQSASTDFAHALPLLKKRKDSVYLETRGGFRRELYDCVIVVDCVY